LFGKTPLKAQNDYVFQKFGWGNGPFGLPGYAYGAGTRLTVVFLGLGLIANENKVNCAIFNVPS